MSAFLRENSRKRLFVNPLEWTKAQLRILNITFKKADRATEAQATSDQPPSFTYKEKGQHVGGTEANPENAPVVNQDAIRAAETLREAGKEMQKLAIRDMLKTYGLVPSK